MSIVSTSQEGHKYKGGYLKMVLQSELFHQPYLLSSPTHTYIFIHWYQVEWFLNVMPLPLRRYVQNNINCLTKSCNSIWN